MTKSLKGPNGILAHLQFRVMREGFWACEFSDPVPAPRHQKFGRNWTVEISGARSGDEYDAALRAVRDVGADYDCRDFVARRGRPKAVRA